MKKKEGVTIKINLSNRWIYFLITLGILAIIGVGVYALTPGGNPSGTPSQNPGHLISIIDPPSPCTADQFLQFDGTNWKCTTSVVDTDTRCDTSGTCTKLCIGTNCKTNWNTGVYKCPAGSKMDCSGRSNECTISGEIRFATSAQTCNRYNINCAKSTLDCPLQGYLIK